VGLIGQHDPTLSQQFFDITIAEREAIVEPDRVADDLGRKSIALIRGKEDVGVMPPMIPQDMVGGLVDNISSSVIPTSIPPQKN
jgi:hypothetical protein